MSFLPDKSKTRHPTSKYIANLIKKEHESVLEHVSWSFILDDVSRAFTHQLVRHRVGFAFSQLSQQYHVESDAAFVVPTGLPETSPSAKLWEDTVSAIQRAYKALLSDLDSKGPQKPKERKRWHRSIARSLMPNATATTIAITANARTLRHFFRVRGTIEGDYEMREVCAALLEIVSQDSPALFADFAIETHIDGEKIVRLRQEPNNS